MSEPYGSNTPSYGGSMPSRGPYIAWLVVGFVTGVLWGLLSLSPFKRMNQAVAENNPDEAWRNARKIRMFALIGIGVNVLLLIVQIGLMTR